jgi:hypothetical protein
MRCKVIGVGMSAAKAEIGYFEDSVDHQELDYQV